MEIIYINLIKILVGFVITAFLVVLGWLAGSRAEKRHYENLRKREQAIGDMLLTDLKTFPMGCEPTLHAMIVTGEVVIASDYLKNLLAKFKLFFGGELRSYHSLMNRARREAILRMLEQAHRHGYNAVGNLRITMVDVSGGTSKKGMGMVEALASGTAYRLPAQTD